MDGIASSGTRQRSCGDAYLKKETMRFERFHFGLVAGCMFLGAAIGVSVAAAEGAIAGMLAGVMIAASVLDADNE